MNNQCPSIYSGPGVTSWFCLRVPDHDGDHRGAGKQWTQAGVAVKCTISLADIEQEKREAWAKQLKG